MSAHGLRVQRLVRRCFRVAVRCEATNLPLVTTRSNIEHRVFERWDFEHWLPDCSPRVADDCRSHGSLHRKSEAFCRCWNIYVEHRRRATTEFVLGACTIGPQLFRALDVSRWSLPARDNRNCLGTLQQKTAAVSGSGSESVVRLNVAAQNMLRGR